MVVSARLTSKVLVLSCRSERLRVSPKLSLGRRTRARMRARSSSKAKGLMR